MTKNLIIDPITKKNIELFLKSPFPCVASIGPAGSGKTFIAEFITDGIELPDTSTISLDAKKSGIDDVRELQKSLKLTTAGDKDIRRVIIISNFDYFGHEAQNSLLKTLEEPPLDTLIIVTINNESKVLDTIYSRVKKINIRPITKKLASDTYTNDHSSDEINRAHSLSMGQAGLFVSLLENKDSHPLVMAINTAKELLKKSKSTQIAGIDKIIKSKEPDFVEIFLDGLFRILNASYNQMIEKQAKNADIKTAYKRLVYINECIDDVTSGLSKKLALTRLLLKI